MKVQKILAPSPSESKGQGTNTALKIFKFS